MKPKSSRNLNHQSEKHSNKHSFIKTIRSGYQPKKDPNPGKSISTLPPNKGPNVQPGNK